MNELFSDITIPPLGFDVVVIDPPWPVKKITRQKRPNQKSMDYVIMSLEDIKNLPIKPLVSESGWIFLWTTQKFLFDAKEVMEGWGIKLLNVMVWEKTYGVSNGMPLFGFRYNAEFVLVGYINKPPLWPARKLIPLVFQGKNTKHSKKPDEFYELISGLGATRLDVFARNLREGWTVWGNEV